MATLRASLEVFQRAGGIGPLRRKTELQVAYLDRRLDEVLGGRVENLAPKAFAERGCQFALRVAGGDGRRVFEDLQAARVWCDWRHPDAIRAAPVPLYNSFADLDRLVEVLDGSIR